MKSCSPSFGPRFAPVILAVVLALGGGLARAQNSSVPAWNPSDPLPKFITHVVMDPKYLVAISKFRSNAGHGYSDDYEWPDSSMKNYYQPLPQYLFGQNGQNTLPEYCPANGKIITITPDGPLSTGEPRGNQISIVPDGYPAFTIVLFHVDTLASVTAGSHVNAGDLLGYADLREAINIDVAVSANWNATPMFVNPGVLPAPGQVLKAPGWKLLSPFDVMSDATFAIYAPYGLTDRSAAVVPLTYRNYHPGQFAQWDPANLDPVEAIIFPVPPVIVDQPLSGYLAPGGFAYFWVDAALTGTLPTYQWFKNGVAIPGATDFTYQIPSVQGSDAGYYSVVLTTPGGSTTSSSALLTIQTLNIFYSFTPAVSRLMNLSVRALVSNGGSLTTGFIIGGTGGKSLLLRAIGPSLSQYGVSGALADPTLALIPVGSPAPLLSNFKWVETGALDAEMSAVGAFALASGSADCAVIVTLQPGAYTVQVSGVGNTSGVALAEVYEVSYTGTAQLVNIATRAQVGTGGNIVIAGFVIGGAGAEELLVRADGPSLSAFGVSGALAQPSLTVTNTTGTTVGSNTGWGAGSDPVEIASAANFVGAFTLASGSADSAQVVSLTPGAYTMQVSGVGGLTGIALAEVYEIP